MSPPIPSTRRKFLLASLISLPALGIAVHGLTAAEAAALAAPELDAYQPEFFSADEWKFILAASDRIIPAEGRGPGALETNVPIFMDQQMHSDFGSEVYMQGPFDLNAPPAMGYQLPYTPQQIYKKGIAAANAWCRGQHQKDFWNLDAAGKDGVLTALQKNQASFGDEVLKPSQFFGELNSDTKNGYLSDPMYGGNKGMKAWIAIGFPGARASFTEWVSQHNVKYPLGPTSIKGLRA